MHFGIQDEELPQHEQLRVSVAGKGDGVQVRVRRLCGSVIGICVKLDRGGTVLALPNAVRVIHAPLPGNVVMLRRRA